MWLVERDTDLSRESLVFQFYRCKEEALRREGHHADDVSNSSRGLLFKTINILNPKQLNIFKFFVPFF